MSEPESTSRPRNARQAKVCHATVHRVEEVLAEWDAQAAVAQTIGAGLDALEHRHSTHHRGPGPGDAAHCAVAPPAAAPR